MQNQVTEDDQVLSSYFDFQGILESAPSLEIGTKQAVRKWHDEYVPTITRTDIQPLLDQMKAAKQAYLTASQELDKKLHAVASQVGGLHGLATRFGLAEGPAPLDVRSGNRDAFLSCDELR
ncbi:hypothetical protein [Brevibacillus borstelensis]|uniref:hypothetical protein n=1 Tax=Brevibacillus borstelensis TaxID=45462 RepID=UPI00287FBA58|nr:hypothetical protein [Brevibacillus borstelensis]WNF06378.1 hypothetical protein RFB14_02750 [Brevibacillus borstelensis]